MAIYLIMEKMGQGDFAVGDPENVEYRFGCMDPDADNYDANATLDIIGEVVNILKNADQIIVSTNYNSS